MGVHQTVKLDGDRTTVLNPLAALALLFAMITVNPTVAEPTTVLVYVFSPDCGACMQFDRDIKPIYPKTEEAKLMPMRLVDFEDWRAGNHTFSQCSVGEVFATPTFIKLTQCVEQDRLTGYSDPELFWLSIGRMVNRLSLGELAP